VDDNTVYTIISLVCGNMPDCNAVVIPPPPQKAFEHSRLEARSLLEQIGKDLKGKVYVYRASPFNWLHAFGECLDLQKYCALSHAGDCRFAEQMLGPDAPWTTNDPVQAKLFVVPILLGMSTAALTNGMQLPSGRSGACNSSSYIRQLHRVLATLKTTPYWGVKPHLIFTGGWQTLTGCSRLAPINDSWIREHCPHNDVTAARRILIRNPKVIVAHFEMATETKDGLVAVHDPYVSGCDYNGDWTSAWRSPLIDRSIAYHFRGRIDHPSRDAVIARTRTCAALQRVESSAHLVCISSGAPRTYPCSLRPPVCNVTFPACPGEGKCGLSVLTPAAAKAHVRLPDPAAGGACPNLATCSHVVDKRDATGAAADTAYCVEMRNAQRVLAVSGDSPSSRRLYEAMELGALPVVISPRWRETVSPIVRWEEFATDLVHGDLGAAWDVTATASSERIASLLQKELTHVGANGCKLEQRRAAMMRWLPMVSWRLDPLTTSMHVLAQAAQQIDALGW
jgi:hypothetical protein